MTRWIEITRACGCIQNWEAGCPVDFNRMAETSCASCIEKEQREREIGEAERLLPPPWPTLSTIQGPHLAWMRRDAERKRVRVIASLSLDALKVEGRDPRFKALLVATLRDFVNTHTEAAFWLRVGVEVAHDMVIRKFLRAANGPDLTAPSTHSTSSGQAKSAEDAKNTDSGISADKSSVFSESSVAEGKK